jgi:pimeloyl-ACP methyl ester carboxylesterase
MAALVVHRSGREAITQPVLVVVGENSAATSPERRELLLSWLPNVESFELARATHLLQVQNALGVAEALASFFARHSLTPSVGSSARQLSEGLENER